EAAARTTCSNNCKQIGLGIHNYSGAFNKLPPLMDYYQNNGSYWAPFWYQLLPYIEQGPLFNKAINQGAGWNNGINAVPVQTYMCPSDISINNGLSANGWAACSYAPPMQFWAPQNGVGWNGNNSYQQVGSG